MVQLSQFVLAVLVLNIFFAVVFVFVVPAIMTIAGRLRIKRILAGETVVIEYEPPRALSPAAVGYLYDAHLTERELLACVLLLEQQGFVERKLVNGTVQFLPLTDKAVQEQSLSMQKAMEYVGMQEAVSDHVLAQRFSEELEVSTHAELVEQHLLKPRHAWSSRRLIVTMLSHALLVATLLVLFAIGQDITLTAAGLAVMITVSLASTLVMTALLFYSEGLQRRLFGLTSYATPEFYALWPHLEGFRQFIEEVELERIRFDLLDQPALSKNEALAYSVALGLESEWQKRFN